MEGTLQWGRWQKSHLQQQLGQYPQRLREGEDGEEGQAETQKERQRTKVNREEGEERRGERRKIGERHTEKDRDENPRGDRERGETVRGRGSRLSQTEEDTETEGNRETER